MMRCSQIFKITGLILILSILVKLSSAIQVQNDDKKIFSHKEDKICIGTNGRMSVPSNREHHYQNLRDRYTNCTLVDGNLELTWLQDKNLDLSFLHSIREVTGYVLISHVDMKKIVLPNLQIIRGRQLFKLNVLDQQFALIVTLSKMENLELPSLRDILQGSAGFYNNYNLCHIRTINWEEIITGFNSTSFYFYNFTQPERECPPCHESCKEGCWGEGEHNCQKFNKIFCSPQCHGGRCFGQNPRECCHLFCAGGCTGPKQNDCLACRNFYDGGVCKQECPSMMRYNPLTYSWETNPAGKYAYGSTCVKDCPDHLLKDNGACVRSCPPNKKALEGECVPCDGPCPKNCVGVEIVNADNIDSFKGCTVVEGSLSILDSTFNGYQDFNTQNSSFGGRHSNMHPDRLSVFKTLKEITGFFNVQGSHPDFTNLSYFSNLEIIGGRQTHDFYSSLYIVRTSLQSLGLRSLRKIRAGGVSILENKNLCLSNEIPWQQILSKPQSNTISIKKNEVESVCKSKNLICDKQCSDEGCWGPNSNECLKCKSYRLEDTCVNGCNTSLGVYDTGSPKLICAYCDEECDGPCNGPGPSNCTQCKNVRDGPYCVASCPESKYNDNGHCKPCSDVCVGGCTGPSSKLEIGGCNSCEKALLSNETNQIDVCLRADVPCPDGFYNEYLPLPEDRAVKKVTNKMYTKTLCRKCHPRCKTCTAYGIHTPQCECLRYSNGEQCEDNCPSDYFADDTNHRCIRCSEHCRGCYGPTESHCEKCKHLTIYYEDEHGVRRFNCTDECPKDKPYRNYNNADNLQVPYCSDREPSIVIMNPSAQDAAQRLGKNVFTVATLIGFIALFILGISIRIYKTARSKEDKLNNAWHMAGFIEDNEPLNVVDNHVKPNLGKIRMINEQELRQTTEPLGFGAFGTVYKGLWIPQGQNVKVPVAIKVLKEDANENFLEEAYIMATVDHPNLVKLLGVCMTSPPMLITPLMPIGCLLSFVRANRDNIGPELMLQWCVQIARGMAYLEDKNIVHRDLALRNVLMQRRNCVKITDFGLAKLLDYNEFEYKAEGGKMPIKWLAPECILDRKFTHKSDVWAFSITIWEIFTFGAKPFEERDPKDMYQYLKQGERPPQPNICSAEVYKTMGYCWLPDYTQRPSFQELVKTFDKFAQHPRQYLLIQHEQDNQSHLMIPSYNYQENNDWLKGLVRDGPEQLMEAEDYLLIAKSGTQSDNGSLVSNSLISNNNNAVFRHMALNNCSRLPSCGSNNGSLPPSTPIGKDGHFFELVSNLNNLNNPTTNSFVNSNALLTLGRQGVSYNRFSNVQNGIATTPAGLSPFSYHPNHAHQSTSLYNRLNGSKSFDDSLDHVKLILTPTASTAQDFSILHGKNNSSSSNEFRKYSQNSADSTIGHYNNCNNINHIREGSMNSGRYIMDSTKMHNEDHLDNVFLPNHQLDSDDYLMPFTAPVNNRQATYFSNNVNLINPNIQRFDGPINMNSSQPRENNMRENLEYIFGNDLNGTTNEGNLV